MIPPVFKYNQADDRLKATRRHNKQDADGMCLLHCCAWVAVGCPIDERSFSAQVPKLTDKMADNSLLWECGINDGTSMPQTNLATINLPTDSRVYSIDAGEEGAHAIAAVRLPDKLGQVRVAVFDPNQGVSIIAANNEVSLTTSFRKHMQGIATYTFNTPINSPKMRVFDISAVAQKINDLHTQHKTTRTELERLKVGTRLPDSLGKPVNPIVPEKKEKKSFFDIFKKK